MFHKCTWSNHSSILIISTKFDEGLEAPPWALVRAIAVLLGRKQRVLSTAVLPFEAGEMSPTQELLPDSYLAPVQWSLAHVQCGAEEVNACNIMLKNTKMDVFWGKLWALLS